jgi:hypothetical protein
MCRKVYFIPVFIATRPPALQVLPVAAFYIFGNSIFRKMSIKSTQWSGNYQPFREIGGIYRLTGFFSLIALDNHRFTNACVV